VFFIFSWDERFFIKKKISIQVDFEGFLPVFRLFKIMIELVNVCKMCFPGIFGENKLGNEFSVTFWPLSSTPINNTTRRLHCFLKKH
jgi:hypothetical protein